MTYVNYNFLIHYLIISNLLLKFRDPQRRFAFCVPLVQSVNRLVQVLGQSYHLRAENKIVKCVNLIICHAIMGRIRRQDILVETYSETKQNYKCSVFVCRVKCSRQSCFSTDTISVKMRRVFRRFLFLTQWQQGERHTRTYIKDTSALVQYTLFIGFRTARNTHTHT